MTALPGYQLYWNWVAGVPLLSATRLIPKSVTMMPMPRISDQGLDIRQHGL